MDRHTLKQLDNQVGELFRHGSPSCIRTARNIMAENFEIILRFALKLTEPKPRPVRTIADNYPADGLTSTEPCMFCVDYNALEEKYDTLKANHGKLVEALTENYEFTKYAGANKRKNTPEYMEEFFNKGLSAQQIAKQTLKEAEKIT